ncbi:MAG: hypothetical protein ABW221_18730 [Vicinamibacteria bacterium]
MDSIDPKPQVAGPPAIVRVLVLLAVLGVVVLLTRCPLTNGLDSPVPPPRSHAL